MEQTLKCNVLKCRKELGDQALVTTCSHIFCIDCSKRHGLLGPSSERCKTCPACKSQLPNPDDAVLTNLHLTEEYKTSILSGLSPSIIMECAGRALSFWAYQTTQECVYQRYLEKILTEKLKTMDQQYQKTVDDASLEIERLGEKLHAQSAEFENMHRRYEELTQSYRDKCRKLFQVQELYDKVKRKAELGQMEAAASDAVHSNLQLGSRFPEAQGPESASRRRFNEYTDPDNRVIHHHSEPEQKHGHSSVGPASFREDMGWSKPGPAPAGIPHTPRGAPRGNGVGNPTRYGPSMAAGLVTGTPQTCSFSSAPGSYTSHRQTSITRGRGLGVGLSSGIRASQISHGPSQFRETQPRVAQRPVLVPSSFDPVSNA